MKGTNKKFQNNTNLLRLAALTVSLLFIPAFVLSGCGQTKTQRTEEFAQDVRSLSGDWQSNVMVETAEYINSCQKYNKTPSGRPCNPKIVECNRRKLAAFNSTPGTSSQKLDAAHYAFIRCEYDFTAECGSLEMSVYHSTKGTEAQKDKAADDAYSACVKQRTGK